MARYTREQIRQAFFAAVSSAAGFAYTSRRMILAAENTPAVPINQPALEVLETGETTQQRGRGLPPVHIFHATLWVWAKIPSGTVPNVPDGVTPGASVINPLIDAIEAALASSPATGVLTLGEMVSHAWIEGETVIVPGDQNPDGQCFAAIPIKIMVP